MDKSLHSSLLGSKSPFSPRSRQSLTGLKRSIAPSTSKKSSRFSVSGKSVQSIQLILKSPYNCVERFGQLLPVLITEALTFAERNIVVSARISENGYAWVVCGRRLLIWQYRQNVAQFGTSQKKQAISSQCFELQLPQSDLAHRSELVSVFVSSNSHIPSCIAVSPEVNRECHCANLVANHSHCIQTLYSPENKLYNLFVTPTVAKVLLQTIQSHPQTLKSPQQSMQSSPVTIQMVLIKHEQYRKVKSVVRYWPAVTHEGVSIEQTVDLQGQECDSLTDIGELGCVLATTTCSVVIVQPQLSGGRNTLNCHTLKQPTGWLGGISKKMSSFIFGPISTEQSAETRLVRVLSVPQSEQVWTVYVLAGHSLQKWKMSAHEPEQLIFVSELNRFVREGFHSTIWENCSGEQSETDVWLLDIQSDKDNVIILAAAANMHVSPQVHYALVSVQTNTSQAPTTLRDFFVLKMTNLYREDNPAESFSYRFLLCGTSVYLYNQRSITVIKPQEKPDVLEFTSSQDLLLGGSICVNTPVFFSRNHGLVSVSSNDLAADFNISSMSLTHPLDGSTSESVMGNLTVCNMDAEEIYNTYVDIVSQFKAAFIFHIKNQQSSCQDIIHKLFLTERQTIPGVDATLDKVVLEICRELLDSIPAGDPRWSHETGIGIGSSYAMNILYQLEDKQRAHNLLNKFLHDTDLWNRLSALTIRDSVLATVNLLGENAEKIVAAIALKKLSNNEILDGVINKVIDDSEITQGSGLTKQDLFFRDVIKIYRVLQELVNSCEEVTHSDRNPSEITTLISETNELLLFVLKEVIQYRQNNVDNFTVHPSAAILSPDYLPWTAARGLQGLNDYLMTQQSITCEYGARMAADNLSRSMLYDQMVSLIDLILDGHKSHLDSIKGTSREDILLKQYQVDRHKLIAPLVLDKEWTRATELAEKYLDFETLVVVCESTNNQARLDDYMDRFSSEGFSEFVYTWYLQENKPGKLIDRCRTISKTKNTHDLTNFLAAHPSLSWLQNIFDKKYLAAADTLRALGQQENELVTRQKTMFSLSKLARLAAPDSEDDGSYIDYIDSRLELIAFQEDLPDYVLQHYGFDTDKLRVISPKDLIHLYICVEYKEATEREFKKALDLLEFMDDDDLRSELALKIWRSAVLRDTWSEGNIDAPLEILQNTLFFKLADLALCLGADPQNLLPSLDVLMEATELQELEKNKNFRYLLKTGYEHVHHAQIAD